MLIFRPMKFTGYLLALAISVKLLDSKKESIADVFVFETFLAALGRTVGRMGRVDWTDLSGAYLMNRLSIVMYVGGGVVGVCRSVNEFPSSSSEQRISDCIARSRAIEPMSCPITVKEGLK